MLLLLKVLLLSIAVHQCSCEKWKELIIGSGGIEELHVDFQGEPAWKEIIKDTLLTTYDSPHGQKYHRIESEEVSLINNPSGPDANFLASCHRFEPNHNCFTTYMNWNSLDDLRGEKLLKVDMVLVDKIFGDPKIRGRPLFYLMDWVHYGYPVSTFVDTSLPYMSFNFIADTSVKNTEPMHKTYFMSLDDRQDRCKAYRPTGTMTGADIMSTALYENMIHGKNRTYRAPGYFFIKKESNICIYKFGINELMSQTDVQPKEFFLLENYPTEGYAPKFFAFDPLYGTFVSLYWNKVCGSHPEAHFFVLNENDPTKTQLVDKFILTDFDQDVLEDIFAERYNAESYPTFASWGRQIYVSFTKLEKVRTFSALWKNEEEFYKMYRAIQGVNFLWHARKDYVQHWSPASFDPAKPHDNVPSASSSTQAPFTHCLPATTTTKEAPTTSTTMKSTTADGESGNIPGGLGKRAAQDDQNVKDAGGLGKQ